MDKRIVVAVLLAAVATSHAAFAQLKAGAIEVAEAETMVRLVSIDPAARMAVVQDKTGATFSILLPAEAQNLDRVKAGDLFRLRYIESVAVELHKGGTTSASGVQTVEVAPKGATPGGRIVRAQQLTATVHAIDRDARTLALIGPRDGTVMPMKVAPEVRAFDEVAVGDTITISYTEALAIERVRDSAADQNAR